MAKKKWYNCFNLKQVEMIVHFFETKGKLKIYTLQKKRKEKVEMTKNMKSESLEAVHTHTHTQMFLEEI